jgi:hypothetical protein
LWVFGRYQKNAIGQRTPLFTNSSFCQPTSSAPATRRTAPVQL